MVDPSVLLPEPPIEDVDLGIAQVHVARRIGPAGVAIVVDAEPGVRVAVRRVCRGRMDVDLEEPAPLVLVLEVIRSIIPLAAYRGPRFARSFAAEGAAAGF